METSSIALISALVLGILALGTYLGYRYVRWRYRVFCYNEDMKERIEILKKEINSAREYVRKTYNTPLDHSVQDNIIPKMDFLMKIIGNKSAEEQETELKNLRDLLAETFLRLNDNRYDPASTLAPLNSLRDRLVQEHLQWLKDHMDEDIFDEKSRI